MGVLLLFIAIVLTSLTGWLGFIYSLVFRLRHFNDYCHRLAKSIDQTGGVIMKDLFNKILIKEWGYKFGNIDETISSCIGKNKVRGSLTKLGKVIDWVLNTLDPNHSLDAIDHTESEE